ncbi:MAG: SDR family oxidoreductase, partial [Clostridiales Family XIII bacterium]|nr:SDR family oxidoreductase [Clostridiales Family XIII bacterium]
IKNAFTEIKSHKKEIHALVNIAGIARDALFRMVTDEDMQKTFQINLFAQIKLTQFISNLMIREKTKGSIVFTSSFAAVFGEMGQLTYAASKAALLGVLRPLSDELGEKGIRVNAVKPGVIDTPIQNSVPDKILEKRVESISLRRMGTAEEVANLFLFLASDLSSHITGQAIKIDGDMGGV